MRVRQTIVRGALAGALLLGLAALTGPVGSIPAAQAAGGVTPNTTLNAMFNSYANGSGYAAMCDDWSGGDGTQSTPLPDGRRVWFFADTNLGDYRLRPGGFDTSFIRNSIVVQNGSSLRTITGGNACQERNADKPFFERYAATPVTDGSLGWFWGGDAIVVGSNLVRFWIRNDTSASPWRETNAAFTTHPLSSFDGATTKVTPQPIPFSTRYGNEPLLWGIALLEDGNDVYVYGSAVTGPYKTRRLFVARSPKATLTNFTTWQFRTANGGWSSSQADAAPVSDSFEPTLAYSVRKIGGRYWLFQQQPSWGGSVGDVLAYPSDTPFGFTDRAVRLYSPPEVPHGPPHFLMHYDVRVHDGLGGTGTVVLSYNVNTTAVSIGCRSLGDHDGSVYRPRFLNVPTSDLVASDAVPIVRASEQEGRSPAVLTSGTDNQWYDQHDQPNGCPPLTKATTLTGSSTPDGNVHLTWGDYGRDIWYWVERRDATAGSAWSRPALWTTQPVFDHSPIGSTADNGHTFQYRIVPFANAGNQGTAPTSNVVSLVVRVAVPATPTGVSATPATPKNGTVTVRWSKVTYPHSHNFYRIFYWDRTAGETASNARTTGWYGETTTSAVLSLTKGHAYSFNVQAQNIAGVSARSAVVNATP